MIPIATLDNSVPSMSQRFFRVFRHPRSDETPQIYRKLTQTLTHDDSWLFEEGILLPICF